MSKSPEITAKPDFNTDVLWRPLPKARTMSTSSESSNGTARRTSISEMFFGSRGSQMGFMQRQSSISSETSDIGGIERKNSITEELLRRQRRILPDV